MYTTLKNILHNLRLDELKTVARELGCFVCVKGFSYLDKASLINFILTKYSTIAKAVGDSVIEDFFDGVLKSLHNPQKRPSDVAQESVGSPPKRQKVLSANQGFGGLIFHANVPVDVGQTRRRRIISEPAKRKESELNQTKFKKELDNNSSGSFGEYKSNFKGNCHDNEDSYTTPFPDTLTSRSRESSYDYPSSEYNSNYSTQSSSDSFTQTAANFPSNNFLNNDHSIKKTTSFSYGVYSSSYPINDLELVTTRLAIGDNPVTTMDSVFTGFRALPPPRPTRGTSDTQLLDFPVRIPLKIATSGYFSSK